MRLLCVLLFIALSSCVSAEELWVYFGIAAGEATHELYLNGDGVVEGRKCGEGYRMDIGPKKAAEFFDRLKDKGLLEIPSQYSYDREDSLSFMLTFQDGGQRLEVSGGSNSHGPTRAVYQETWALHRRLVRNGQRVSLEKRGPDSSRVLAVQRFKEK